MSLRACIYAFENLRVQSLERFHVETPVAEPVPSPAEMRERNAQSMAQLQSFMGGVQGAPRVG